MFTALQPCGFWTEFFRVDPKGSRVDVFGRPRVCHEQSVPATDFAISDLTSSIGDTNPNCRSETNSLSCLFREMV